jgi:hypothetical protein
MLCIGDNAAPHWAQGDSKYSGPMSLVLWLDCPNSTFMLSNIFRATTCQASCVTVKEGAQKPPAVEMRSVRKRNSPQSWWNARTYHLVLLSRYRPDQKATCKLDPLRPMPIDQPRVPTFRISRGGTVLEQASISPDLGFLSPQFSRRGLGGVAPKPGRLASHSVCARSSSQDSHFIIGRQTTRV